MDPHHFVKAATIVARRALATTAACSVTALISDNI